jgi:hypothetical protein
MYDGVKAMIRAEKSLWDKLFYISKKFNFFSLLFKIYIIYELYICNQKFIVIFYKKLLKI